MWYIWFGIIILLSLIEYISTKTIWFIVSAIVSLIFSFIVDSFVVQFLIFILGGLFLLEMYKEEVVKKEHQILEKIGKKKTKKRQKRKSKSVK